MFSKRRIHKTFLYVFLITATLVGTSFLRSERMYDASYNEIGTPPSTTAKSVTKSMSEMLAELPELSDHVVFFNRVPKSGSEMLVLLMQWLQGLNGFRHIRLPGGKIRKLDRVQQEQLVEKVTEALHDETIPLSFDRHVYFVNFTSFGRQSPIYINLVRDPVDKAVSRFYYSRATPSPLNPDLRSAPTKPKIHQDRVDSFEQCVELHSSECTFLSGKSYDLAIPYFCGQDKWCTLLNEQRALEKAKANVDRYYPVVGVLEELNSTLAVLEKKLPYFFKGVQDMYFKLLLQPHKNRNRLRPRNVSDQVRNKLKTSLKLEYEFYYWLQDRLRKQFSLL